MGDSARPGIVNPRGVARGFEISLKKEALTMQGAKKQFVNFTGNTLALTLHLRKAADPTQSAGSNSVVLKQRECYMEDLSPAPYPLLNGIELTAHRDGAMLHTASITVKRGSPLDLQLNNNDTFLILFANGTFHMNGTAGLT